MRSKKDKQDVRIGEGMKWQRSAALVQKRRQLAAGEAVPGVWTSAMGEATDLAQAIRRGPKPDIIGF